MKYLKITLAVVVVVLMNNLQGTVQALSPAQKKVIDSGVYYFDVEASNKGCASLLPGSDNEEKIWNYFVSKGLQPQQIAGIMGNLQAESHFEPRLVQYGGTNSRGETSVQGKPSSIDDNMRIDGTTGYGLAQWTFLNRQQGLHDAAVKASTKDSDLGVQLDFLWHELAGLLPEIQALNDVSDVTSLFMLKFERPADQSQKAQNERAKLSIDILTRLGSGGGSADTSGAVVSGCGSGQLVGGYSLPTSREFYDQNTATFLDAHHDYPATDIGMPEGTPIYSMTAGKVYSANQGGKCGAGVTIITDDGTRFNYCHGIDGGSIEGAKLGDTVTAGQHIMNSGNTGRSFGPHLHLGITTSDGIQRCPQTLFSGIASGTPPDLYSLPTKESTPKCWY